VIAILASPRYRARCDHALRADYPRIPRPPSVEALAACVEAGEALEHAFASARGGAPIVIGHHTVESDALRQAIDLAERASESALREL
jgi:hypothetical protein